LAADEERVLYTGIGLERDCVSFLKRHGYEEFERGGCRLVEEAAAQIREYLSGERYVFRLPLKMMGSRFSESVWRTVLGIQYGSLRTYRWVSKRLGLEYARPVGRALSANHLMLIVPCHRVIASSGDLGGFRVGISIKRALIMHEARNRPMRDNAISARAPSTF